MPNQIFLDFIGLRREARNLEYKQSTSWSDKTFQAKITKSILAMSNIRDGGHIIIGMKRQADDSYVAEGMEQSHLDSLTADSVRSIVAQFADPYVQITLTKEEDDRRQRYVWIQVQEFEETPVVCRKSYSNILSGGKLYTRTRRRFESAEVPRGCRNARDYGYGSRKRHQGISRAGEESQY